MVFYYADLGTLSRGSIIELTLTGDAGNVRLLDASNFDAYSDGRPESRAAGGYVTRSPIHLKVPRDGHWYVTVDYGPRGNGSGQRYYTVYHPDLPKYRERGLPRRVPIRESKGWMSRNLNDKRQQRLVFMRRLYEISGGETTKDSGKYELGKEFGWTPDETDSVTEYLDAEGLLEITGEGTAAQVRLKHAGVLEVEKAIANPNAPTEHFPALRWIVERRAADRLRNSPWRSGSFYLFAFVSPTTLLLVVGRILALWLVPVVASASLLSILVIGALQLRHDEALSEEGFLRLIHIVLRKLPTLAFGQPGHPRATAQEIETGSQPLEGQTEQTGVANELHPKESELLVEKDSSTGEG
jgi:hypothetical protein